MYDLSLKEDGTITDSNKHLYTNLTNVTLTKAEKESNETLTGHIKAAIADTVISIYSE